MSVINFDVETQRDLLALSEWYDLTVSEYVAHLVRRAIDDTYDALPNLRLALGLDDVK